MKWRSFPNVRFCLILIFVLVLSYPLAAREIHGVIFNDVNKNLKLDSGEKGIKGVLVSNQREVVQTDRKGNYTLPISDDRVIFITKPAGYAVPLDRDNLPQFYYIYEPAGSPPQKYKGVAPTGPLPESLNFPLFESKETDTFDAIVFADTQPANLEEVAYIRDDVVSEVVGTKAAFGITLGDVLFDDLSFYDSLNAVIAQIGIPFYNVPGNHDENYDSPDDRYALETFKSHFGPTYYSFDYGKVHFVVLDDVEWHGKTAEKRGWYRGMIGEKQLGWLKNDLNLVPADKLVVVTMHIPIRTILGSDQGDQINDRATLFEILKNRDHVLALAGHNHTLEHQYFGESSGWAGKKPLEQIICSTVCGCWWGGPKDERGIPIADQYDGTPNGYHIFHFEGTAYSERFKAANRDSDYQLRISAPRGTIATADLPKTEIVVNVFDGGDRSVVECQIDGKRAVKMQKSEREDPFFVEVHEANKDAFKSWSKPKKCAHLWVAPLPGDLQPGLHTIVVRTTDEFGNSYRAARIIQIE
jgi:hypothetical protein